MPCSFTTGAGEKNIAFELKNSHIPMYVLHDIYLEDGDLSAQIDYLVVTRKLCFVIESKNLYGNIEITSNGDFIRTIEFGGRKKKEGIYSPITKNQRHLELMRKLKTEKNKNFILKSLAAKYFEDFNKAVVVLTNPKTVLNAKYAQKEIRDIVIRADQLIQYIKKMCDDSKELASSDEDTRKLAQFYLSLHKDTVKDYTAKYNVYRIQEPLQETADISMADSVFQAFDIMP